MTKHSPSKYFKTSPEIIRLAVMLYVRFPLSLRNIEELLHEWGVGVSHETVRFWWHRFGLMFAAEIRKRRIEGMKSSRWRWHLDENFVNINCEMHYLWRAVDLEGKVLHSFVTKRWDKKVALKFLRKAMRKYGRLGVIVTDRLYSDGQVVVLRSRRSAQAICRKPVGRQTTGRRISICRFDDEKGPCCASGACKVLKSSPLSKVPFIIISTKSAISPAATISGPIGPLLLPSGVSLGR